MDEFSFSRNKNDNSCHEFHDHPENKYLSTRPVCRRSSSRIQRRLIEQSADDKNYKKYIECPIFPTWTKNRPWIPKQYGPRINENNLPPSQTANKNIIIVDTTDNCSTLTAQIFTFRINKNAFIRFILIFMVFRFFTIASMVTILLRNLTIGPRCKV